MFSYVVVKEDGVKKFEAAEEGSVEIVVGSMRRLPAPSVTVVVIEKGGVSPKGKRIVLAEAVRILIDEMNRIGGAHVES
jgi:hypothetical protein